MFLLDITFHLHDLDLQGKNSTGWDLAAALCSFHYIFSNADGKVDFCIMKEGWPCVQTCTKQSSDTQKKRVIKSGRWKGTVAVAWLFIHFVTIHS